MRINLNTIAGRGSKERFKICLPCGSNVSGVLYQSRRDAESFILNELPKYEDIRRVHETGIGTFYAVDEFHKFHELTIKSVFI